MSRKAALCALFLGMALAAPAHAASRHELEQTEAEIEKSKAEQERLAGERKKLESDLAATQKQLVRLGASLQETESELAGYQEKLRIFREQAGAKGKALAARQEKLDALVRAALRLSRMPPEAMVLMSGDENEMQAARALKLTSDAIRADMAEIAAQKAELERLERKMADRRREQEKQKEALEQKRRALAAGIAERKALRKSLGARQEEEEKRAAELARKAEDLQGLVRSLKRVVSAPQPGAAARKAKTLRSFADARGRVRAPLEGKLVRRFGQKDERGGRAQGVTLAAAADGAQVVAPYDGEVVFSGPFLAYGKLAILRHSGDFHTLLAGMEDLNVAVGDFLLEGEPIGAMGRGAKANRLYLELRKDNQPVNPEPWIRGLKTL